MPTIKFENATGTFTYEEQAPIDPPPIEPPTTEPPPEGGDVWQPPSYLRSDTRTEAIPNTPKPGYLQESIDPTFHSRIIRITGDPGSSIRGISGARWGDQARHHYNSDQAWNCDQSLIYLDTNKGSGGTGGLCLNGSTYEPAFMIKNIPSDSDVRWSVTDPALMYFAAGSKLGTWNPKTGITEIIKNFGSAYSDCKFGPWEGSFSEDGDSVVISCRKSGSDIGFAYAIATDKKYPDIERGAYDNVRISSKGNYVIWKHDPDKVVITDLAGTEVHTLPNNYVSHFDVITDQDGDEVLVGRNNGAGGGTGGAMTKYRLRDGKKLQLCSGGWCSHTSTRSKTHKYAVSAATDEGGNVPPPYRGELLMSNLDGSKTYRLGHTHEPASIDYVAETQPSHSPDGGRVIFASAWGASGSTPRPVGCYIADFRT